jgi:hypothetical protein
MAVHVTMGFFFDNAIVSSGIPDALILPLVANYVNVSALQLLKTYMRDRGTSWNKFKQMLVMNFQPIDYCYRLRVKLTKLKQGSDTIDNYNKQFLKRSTQLTEI